MRVVLTLPRHVESAVTAAVVLKVCYGPQEPVREGEPVLELVNEDGVFDLRAPTTGVVVEVAVKEGDRVRPGTTLLVLESGRP